MMEQKILELKTDNRRYGIGGHLLTSVDNEISAMLLEYGIIETTQSIINIYQPDLSKNEYSFMISHHIMISVDSSNVIIGFLPLFPKYSYKFHYIQFEKKCREDRVDEFSFFNKFIGRKIIVN